MVDRVGRVVAWDPCTPIAYWLYRPGIPRGGEQAVRQVLDEVTDIAGYRFPFAGWTDIPPAQLTDLQSTVFIGWLHGDDTDLFDVRPGDVAGQGGLVTVNGRPAGGFAVVRSRGRRGRRGRGTGADIDILRHEVGHMLGLDHVDDRAQVMHPTTVRGRRPGWGDGDRAGLQAMAELGCRH